MNSIPTPKEMSARPIDHRGFRVPWFVTDKTPDGLWDFVRVRPERFAEAVRRDVCWVSGVPLGRFRSFIIGPMCVINRVAADPPTKKNIAEWSAQVCPFLSRPLARRDRDLTPDDYKNQRGVMLERNPGVCAIYTITGHVKPQHGLFYLPEPVSVEWCALGRRATRDEVDQAIASGLPTLREMASKEGTRAEAELERCINRAEPLLPEAKETA